MQMTGAKLVVGVVLGAGVVGAGLYLAGCTPRNSNTDPMGDLTKQLMGNLKPNSHKSGLNVVKDAVRQMRADDGHATGAFDGARLLNAADNHAYGTPTIGDPAKDVQGDGTATFNEVRHVIAHFDVDASGVFDREEKNAFEEAVGVRWLPAT